MRFRVAPCLLLVSSVPLAVFACRGSVDRVYAQLDGSIVDSSLPDVRVEPDGGPGSDAQPDTYVPPCADESSTQPFTGGMGGCPGMVTWADRATLCGSGCVPCTAEQWRDLRGDVVPEHHYWTNDDLHYDGTGPNACSVSLDAATGCAAAPMRVCAPGAGTGNSADPEGNQCNWVNCTLLPGDGGNDYFGGCSGNTTAGTLCCCP